MLSGEASRRNNAFRFRASVFFLIATVSIAAGAAREDRLLQLGEYQFWSLVRIVERHRFRKPAPLVADFSRFATLDPDLNT